MAALIISSETITRLNEVARQRGNPVEDLAEDIIRRFLREEARRRMDQEAEAFRMMHPNLLATYPNQYVAIYQGQLVDHDIDELALYLRIEQQYPHETVLIRQVLPAVEVTYTVRSPRFVG